MWICNKTARVKSSSILQTTENEVLRDKVAFQRYELE